MIGPLPPMVHSSILAAWLEGAGVRRAGKKFHAALAPR